MSERKQERMSPDEELAMFEALDRQKKTTSDDSVAALRALAESLSQDDTLRGHLHAEANLEEHLVSRYGEEYARSGS